MIDKSGYLFITLFIVLAGISVMFSIETSKAQENEIYITSSHPRAVYYYPESCKLWEVLSESFIVRFNSLEALLKKHEDKSLHPHCLEEGQNSQEHLPLTPLTPSLKIIDGDLIQAMSSIDVYIVKIVGEKRFKRLILNPAIFDSYGHLRWDKIKKVPNFTLDQYTTSNLVQQINPDGSIADGRVFQLFPSGDTGIKRHIAITPDEFNKAGGDWDSVYYINSTEAGDNFYITNSPIDDAEEFEEVLEEQEQEIEDGISLNPEPEKGPVTLLPPADSNPSFPDSPIPLGRLELINVSANQTTVTLSWNEIAHAINYKIRYKKTDETNWIESSETIIGEEIKTTTIENLTLGEEYEFQVKAMGDGTSYLDSEWSDSTSPITLLVAVGDLNFGITTASQVYLSWTEVTGAAGYEVEYKNETEDWTTVTVISFEAQVTGLIAGITYTFRVRAKNENVFGAWSSEQDHATLDSLERVDALTFGTTTVSEINLSWDAIAGAADYEVKYRPNGENYISENVIVVGTTARVTDLNAGTTYTFKVRATQGNIRGRWSARYKHSTLE